MILKELLQKLQSMVHVSVYSIKYTYPLIVLWHNVISNSELKVSLFSFTCCLFPMVVCLLPVFSVFVVYYPWCGFSVCFRLSAASS